MTVLKLVKNKPIIISRLVRRMLTLAVKNCAPNWASSLSRHSQTKLKPILQFRLKRILKRPTINQIKEGNQFQMQIPFNRKVEETKKTWAKVHLNCKIRALPSTRSQTRMQQISSSIYPKWFPVRKLALRLQFSISNKLRLPPGIRKGQSRLPVNGPSLRCKTRRKLLSKPQQQPPPIHQQSRLLRNRRVKIPLKSLEQAQNLLRHQM